MNETFFDDTRDYLIELLAAMLDNAEGSQPIWTGYGSDLCDMLFEEPMANASIIMNAFQTRNYLFNNSSSVSDVIWNMRSEYATYPQDPYDGTPIDPVLEPEAYHVIVTQYCARRIMSNVLDSDIGWWFEERALTPQLISQITEAIQLDKTKRPNPYA